MAALKGQPEASDVDAFPERDFQAANMAITLGWNRGPNPGAQEGHVNEGDYFREKEKAERSSHKASM